MQWVDTDENGLMRELTILEFIKTIIYDLFVLLSSSLTKEYTTEVSSY